MNVQENYRNIRSTIEKTCEQVGRNANEVHVVAVTKYVSVQRAKEALAAGVKHLGKTEMKVLLKNRKYRRRSYLALYRFIANT